MSSGLVHVDLRDTIGALQIGSLFAIFLFGIVTVQAYLYYNAFREDRWTYKTLVSVHAFLPIIRKPYYLPLLLGGCCVVRSPFVMKTCQRSLTTTFRLLEVGHTAGVSYEVYDKTITFYGNPNGLLTYPALGAVIAISGVITLLVQVRRVWWTCSSLLDLELTNISQGFFSLRLYRILPKPYKYIGVVCFALSFIRCIGSLYLTAQAVTAQNLAQYSKQWQWLVTSLLVVGTAIDIIIAVSMLWYLGKKRGAGLLRYVVMNLILALNLMFVELLLSLIALSASPSVRLSSNITLIILY